jgi:hypothetical protein
VVRIRFLLSIVDAINFDADVGLQFCFRGGSNGPITTYHLLGRQKYSSAATKKHIHRHNNQSAKFVVRIRFLLSIVDAINFDADVGLQFCFRGLGQFK